MTDPANDGEDIQRYCPPHFYLAAWASENEGILFCRLCGSRLPMTTQTIEAPAEEKISEPPADWGSGPLGQQMLEQKGENQ